MKLPFHPLPARTVKTLTIALAAFLAGCSLIDEHYDLPCNSRAYNRMILSDYLSSRFHSGAPVRLAIIPFSVPANLSGSSPAPEAPGLGNELAWKVHAELLRSQAIPIVEVLNRDWPGKKEEFFTGNFGAISQAREAQYDLVLVGYMETLSGLDRMRVYTKLIEAESGITVWYGETNIETYDPDLQATRSFFWLETRRPSRFYLRPMVDRLAQCIAGAIASEEPELT